MKSFEYLITLLIDRSSNREWKFEPFIDGVLTRSKSTTLNELGSEGWELSGIHVGTYDTFYIFKREY